MDPMGEEQLDYGDDDFTGSNPNPHHHHHHHHQTAAAIPALAEDEMLGDDDEYDDLYNDVNVGENFMQHTSSNLHQNQVNKNPNRNPNPSPFGNDSGSVPAVARVEPPRPPPVVPTPEQNPTFGTHISNSRASPQLPQDNDLGFQRGPPAPQMPVKVAVPPAPAPPVIRPAVGPVNVNGPTMLFVGELHWWTTDADLESVLTQFGRVKEIKFFDERASGKSKGYCQVEFFEAAAAAACKEGMDGYEFNGRSCVVAFASPQTLRQMGANYVNRSQGQGQGQGPQQHQGRRQMNDGPMGRGGGNGGGVGDGGGRGFGRGGWGGRGQGMMGRGQSGGGMMRGRGFAGGKGMMGPGSNNGGVGNNGPYGQGFGGPVGLGGAGGMMHPQNMMGAGFDPTYMGRGGPYGGFSAPAFTGMMNPFQAVNAVGLPGVAPHVNPAFFGRGMSANGMGVMGNSGMEGQMWGDASMGGGGWTGDELGRKTRESSYGGDDGASEYGYGEMNHERGGRSNLSREKERGSERDWSGNSERRHRDEREQDWDRSDRERHREEKDGYREYRSRDRDYDNEADWDKGQSSSRSRSRMMQEDDHRSRSRDTDYGKRRRIPSE